MNSFARFLLFSFALAIVGLSLLSVGSKSADARRPVPSPTPVATPMPTPVPTVVPYALRVARLNDVLTAIAHIAPGNLGLAVYDPGGDTHVSIHGDATFALANIAKLPLALAAFRLADDRKLNLDGVFAFQPGDVRFGNSPLAQRYPQGGVSLPLWRLLRGTIVDGDNSASDLVLRAIGEPSDVQHELNALDLAGFTIRRSEGQAYDDLSAGRTFQRGGGNGATPDGLAALLVGLSTQKELSLNATTEFLLDLSRAHPDERLSAGFPTGTRFYDMTAASPLPDGTLEVESDAGLLTLPDGERIAVVAMLAGSTADAATRQALFTSIGKAVYEAFAPP